jgi:hypothetical protein
VEVFRGCLRPINRTGSNARLWCFSREAAAAMSAMKSNQSWRVIHFKLWM